MGRPSTFDPSTAEQIITLVSAGNYPKIACLAVGVSKATMHLWLKNGREYDRAVAAGETPIADHEQYAKFSRRYDKAHGWALVKLNASVDKATDKDWRAAAWKMGVLAPGIYGEKSQKANPLNDKIARAVELRNSLSQSAKDKLADVGEAIADEMGAE